MSWLSVAATVVALLAAIVGLSRWAYPRLLMPVSKVVATRAARLNLFLDKRRLRAIQKGARLPCSAPECNRIVSSAGDQTQFCDECARAYVKRTRDEMLSSLPVWWAGRMTCLACGHRFNIVCPECNAPGFLPVPHRAQPNDDVPKTGDSRSRPSGTAIAQGIFANIGSADAVSVVTRPQPHTAE